LACFFVLVVLVVEAIFGIAASFCSDPQQSWLIVAMIVLIFCLIAIVALLACFRPEALRGQRVADAATLPQGSPRGIPAPCDSSTAARSPGILEISPSSDFMKRGYPRSQHPEFFTEVERLVQRAKKITLIATGLNLIWEKHLLDLLLRRAQTGDADVTICLGNPFSPHVEDRLIEEEMGDNRPPVGREGIIKNTETLVERLNRAGNPPNFRVLLFEHYPTFATLIFDEEIFIYPYAYQILGNLSPIFHLVNNGGEVAGFFMSNAQRITSDAVSAREVLRHRQTPTYSSDSWIGAAVFLVPGKEDPLFRLGTELLGYDIWQEQELPSVRFENLRPSVGDAREFGFHATVVDALLFATESAVDRVEAELRALAKEFRPFVVSGFQLVDRFNKRGDIVLRCEDKSGTIEALHHEMVTRVHGMAISSYYTVGRGRDQIETDEKRDALMMERYGAPFILGRFQLHFTLLANPPQQRSDRGAVLRTLKAAIEDLSTDVLEIHEVVLVTRTSRDPYWRVRERFQLTKQ